MRAITLHDTRSGAPAPLQPRDPGKVGIYACGPTVYSRVHVGNARPYVVFSLLKRFLAHVGYDATLVVNVTDINDKIYDAARAAGVGSEDLAREMTAHYVADTDRLALGRPDHEPLASETIDGIVALIEALVERGHAYPAGGDVYFRVRSLPSYGELSHRDVDAMDQGEGVEGADRKEDPLDFALWKAAKPEEDTRWPSPWGEGRPGWHIECSAMAEKLLGVELDVHGGGIDLAFPHHENEAAQTLAARGRRLARIWMHNGMVQAAGDEKMSKSLGNISGLAEVLDEFGRDAVVLWLVSGHYRQPLAFSREALEQAGASVERIRDVARRLDSGEAIAEANGGAATAAATGPDGGEGAPMPQAPEPFLAALADDFNTPRALAVLFDWIREANRDPSSADRAELAAMLELLGLEGLLRAEAGPPEELLALARQRADARARRDWAEADRLRDALREQGWEVRDGPAGPELVRAT